MKTICATITSPIRSSITIIRISGPQTIECLKQIGVKKTPLSHQSFFHKIQFIDSSDIIDEGIITYYKAPKSFTGEDVAEISIHSSPYIIKLIFKKLLSIENVDLAEGGEFSKRAFLNGKIDLVQAEAIPDLIASETEIQHKQAIRQLQGDLGKIYEEWTQKIIKISSYIEALIDFPEDDLPDKIINDIVLSVNELKKEISAHINDNQIGQKIKNGLNIAIIGAPNVGKSSLINLFSKSEVAIVSDIAGTTRDSIDCHLEINGIPIIITDTAGIRLSDDKIEQEGIKRAITKSQNADIIIYIVDSLNPVIMQEHINERTILVVNKIDELTNLFNRDKFILDHNLDLKTKIVEISVTKKINIKNLLNIVEQSVEMLFPNIHLPSITQERYRIALQNCLYNLKLFDIKDQIEINAEKLRICLNEIAKIRGKISIEEILDSIFSKFCIGK